MLIVGRAVAGIGASGLLNGAYTILAVTVPPEKQACKPDSLILTLKRFTFQLTQTYQHYEAFSQVCVS